MSSGKKVLPEGLPSNGDNSVRQNKTSLLRRMLSVVSGSREPPPQSFRDMAQSIRQAFSPSNSLKSAYAFGTQRVPNRSTSERIYKGRKLLWRRRIDADIIIFQHSSLDIFEIVPILKSKSMVLNRLYVKISVVNGIVEDGIANPDIKVRENKRRQMIKYARLQCAIDMIMECIDTHSADIELAQCVKCTFYNGEMCCFLCSILVHILYGQVKARK
jgi:hypothetical protein